jgi:hypothetical protein
MHPFGVGQWRWRRQVRGRWWEVREVEKKCQRRRAEVRASDWASHWAVKDGVMARTKGMRIGTAWCWTWKWLWQRGVAKQEVAVGLGCVRMVIGGCWGRAGAVVRIELVRRGMMVRIGGSQGRARVAVRMELAAGVMMKMVC